MSSLKNAAKAYQTVHKERHQPESRKQLGFLEKKKDYKHRARDFHRKQKVLKALKRKASNRNPDEYYFHMINSKVEDGLHHKKEKAEEFTPEQLKLMQTQDINYITYRQSIESKKIQRLQSELHMLDAEDRTMNKHVIFVDDKKQAKKLDLAEYFNTHPSLLDRTYNRPKIDTLKNMSLSQRLNEEIIDGIKKVKKQRYKELTNRITREKELALLNRKMFLRKQLANKKEEVKKIKDGTKTTAPVYLWKKERKR